MRRFLWSLNDESGGIGRARPEAMAECMCRDVRLADEYAHMPSPTCARTGKNSARTAISSSIRCCSGVCRGVPRWPAAARNCCSGLGAVRTWARYLEADDPMLRGLAARPPAGQGEPALRRCSKGCGPYTRAAELVRRGRVVRNHGRRPGPGRPGGVGMTDTLFPAAACVQFAIVLGEPDRNLDRVISLVEAYRPARAPCWCCPRCGPPALPTTGSRNWAAAPRTCSPACRPGRPLRLPAGRDAHRAWRTGGCRPTPCSLSARRGDRPPGRGGCSRSGRRTTTSPWERPGTAGHPVRAAGHAYLL